MVFYRSARLDKRCFRTTLLYLSKTGDKVREELREVILWIRFCLGSYLSMEVRTNGSCIAEDNLGIGENQAPV